MENIFLGKNPERIKEITNIINKHSSSFGIDSKEKMAHFLGQMGAETNLVQLTEQSYSESGIRNNLKPRTLRTHNGNKVIKYCSLFEGYTANYTSNNNYPYCNKDIVVPSGMYYVDGSGITYAKKEFMKNLTPKKIYFDQYPTDLDFFDVVYAHQLDNGTINSKDGSRFRGRGFMQLTGHYNYNKFVQQPWDNVHGKGNKDFMCRSTTCDANLNAIADDLEFSMKIAMASFQNACENLKDKTDLERVDKTSIENISTGINGGFIGLPNRKKYSKNAYDVFNKN